MKHKFNSASRIQKFEINCEDLFLAQISERKLQISVFYF